MPKVNDVKAMDVSLIGCFAFIFFALPQIFVKEICLMKRKKNHKIQQSLDFNPKNVAKVSSYSVSSPEDNCRVPTLKIKNKNVKKFISLFTQNILKYITLQHFFIYAMYRMSFFLYLTFSISSTNYAHFVSWLHGGLQKFTAYCNY